MRKVVPLTLLLVGCWPLIPADQHAANLAESDTDTDADSDGDTDSDSDADTDADSDADTDADSDADSDADTDTDPAREQACGDGSDDDLDGATDCADDDCWSDLDCSLTCPNFPITGVPMRFEGTTTGFGDDGAPSCRKAGGGEDVSLAWTAPADGTFGFVLNPIDTTFDSLLSVSARCGGLEVACDDDSSLGAFRAGEALGLTLSAGDTVTLWVDGNGASGGDFALDVFEMTAAEVDCSDGIDEDADDRLDCYDRDCNGDPACVEDCTSFLDEDADLLFGCLDPDCATDAFCTGACPAATMNATGTWAGTTVGAPNASQSLACGAGSMSPDAAVEFTAPSRGRYVFRLDPAATTFDAVLSLTDGCGGAELGCHQLSSTSDEDLVMDLAAGERVVAVIDGVSGVRGEFALEVTLAPSTEATCDDGFDEDVDALVDCQDPDCDADPACLGSCPVYTESAVPASVSGLLTLFDDVSTPSCAPSTTDDLTLEFTAPTAGDYRFSTLGSSFDTVLALYDQCRGVELACDDDTVGTTSEVVATMGAGDSVVVTVSGYQAAAGLVQLAIDEVGVGVPEGSCTDGLDGDGDGDVDCNDFADCSADPSCATCPDDDLGSTLSASGSNLVAGDDWSATCGGAGGREATFLWTAPTTGSWTFDTVGSTFDTVLYVRRSCGGADLACNDDAVGLTSAVSVFLLAGQSVDVFVDAFDATEVGNYVLTIY